MFIKIRASLVSRWSLICLCLFASLFTERVLATTEADEIWGLLSNMKTMEASFKQTVYDNRERAIQHSFGKMELMRPGKFRWSVKKPMPQVIIANQARLWIYDPDLDQVTIRFLGKSAGEVPALLLSQENNTLDRDFSIESMPQNTDGMRWFSLVPKTKEGLFENVQLAFANNQVKKIKLKDHLGHITIIEFNDVHLNRSLSTALFTFKANKNIDVIDETRKKR